MIILFLQSRSFRFSGVSKNKVYCSKLIKLNFRQINKQIYNYLLAGLAFFIPVNDRIAALLIVLIGLNWIAEFNFREKFQLLLSSRQRILILLFAVFYLIYLIGTIYSANLYGQEGAFFDLEIKLSFLFFPLIFSTMDSEHFSDSNISKILSAFVFGCFLTTLILVYSAIDKYLQNAEISNFFYTGLSSSHHPSYLAMFFSLAVIYVAHKLVNEHQVKKPIRFLFILAVIILETMIVLLSSKAGIIGMITIFLAYMIFIFIRKEKKYWLQILLVVALFTSFMLLTLFSAPTYKRFFEAEKALGHNNYLKKDSEASTEVRLLVWKSALEVIRQHPFAGVGTGDVKQELMKKYSEKGYQLALAEKLNAHNQYLQTYIATGILGFLILAIGLILPGILAVRRNQIMYLVFVLLIGFHILVESMLERQAGVVFYAFFNGLLFSNLILKKNSTSELSEI
jgi:O-antigen ligase